MKKLIFIFMVLFCGSAQADNNPLLHTFENPSPDADDQFGSSVSVGGDWVLVGVPDDDTTGERSGRAYLFDAVTGSLVHTFANPSPYNYPYPINDAFGSSVSVDGDRVLVGAREDSTTSGPRNSGRAYLFDAVTGNLVRIFENPMPGSSDQFGSSVSVDGDRVLVIAVGDDSQCYNCGNAFLFDAVTGNLVHTFENPSPHEDHGFQAGSVAGDWVLMGVPNDDTTGYFSGRAYLFDAMTGNLVHTIENPTPDLGYDRFGSSVSVDGDRVLVGSIFDDNNGFYDNGSAYLFDAVTGNLVHTFENPSPDVSGRFGSGVSVVGDHVLVGAYHDDTTGDRSGRAFLFNALTGSLVHTFDNPSPDDYDYFGLNVSVADDWALVGVPNDDTTGAESGRAYLFELRGYTEATINIYDSVLHPRHGGSGSNQDDVIPVIVYGSSTLVGDLADLNTDDIDVSTLRFGPGMGSISPTAQSWFNFDVDSDGLDDAIFQFQMSDAAFDKVTCSDETGALVGDLTTGETFGGEDTFISDCNAGCH